MGAIKGHFGNLDTSYFDNMAVKMNRKKSIAKHYDGF